MKKLLSLLSVLTISGTTVPTIVAVSPYKNQEYINSDINYQQKNLKTLNRNKRNINYLKEKISNLNEIVEYYGNTIDNNGNFYFATNNGFYVIKNKTLNAEKINGINDNTSGALIMCDNNNNIYFGTNNNVYKLSHGRKVPEKINGIDGSLVGIVDNNNNIYFATANNSGYVFLLKNDSNNLIKINGMPNKIFFTIGIDNSNNIYFGTSDGAYILKPNERTATKMNGINGSVYYFVVDNFNNLFIGAHNGLYIKNSESSVVVYNNFELNIRSVLIDKENNFYFGTFNGVYILKNKENILKKINGINNETHSMIIDKNNNVYFATKSGGYFLEKNSLNANKISKNIIGGIQRVLFCKKNSIVYFLTYNDGIWIFKNKELSNYISNSLLEKINDYSDISILNELNYLNPTLDISQLEVINKTSTSAIIKAKNNSNNYTGTVKIYYSSDSNSQNKIIDLNELIKKGIFLSYRDKNKENIIKEIKNIITNNLIYSNVLITKNIEPIVNENKENICSGKIILENNLATEQKLRTSNCKYTIQEIKSFQITTGLSKTTGLQTNSEVSSSLINSNSSASSLQTGHSQINSSSKSWEVSGNAGFNLFGFSIGGSGGSGGQSSSTSETSSLTSYSSSQEISKSFSNSFSKSISLSNSFDLGNSQEKQNIKIFELELPFQEFTVEGNQTIEVSTFLDKVLLQTILTLKQDIFGEINAEIINENNEKITFQISIKEIMQKLKQYNILPQEITTNDDNSITFNGKANISYQSSTIGKTSIREIETF